jgi:type II secretory pathway pseudopilin PulG
MFALASPRGFTLFETLVATGILVTALAGIAQLLILGTQLTRQANASGAALVAAQDKLEELSGKSFNYAADGSSVTEPSLELSPESTLDEDAPPYVDWIDSQGSAHVVPDGAVFARRWRVSSIGEGAPDAIAVEVCVFRMPSTGASAQSADACLSTARARQP